MSLGFIHGVMNTDNMTLSGETIDYGPCAFMDHYDPATVFSSIDEGGRYAYANQPRIGQWNIARLAECLLPLLAEEKDDQIKLATEVVNQFAEVYMDAWVQLYRDKLGLNGADAEDFALAQEFLKTMEGQGVDYTLAFRHLAEAASGDDASLKSLYRATTLLDPWLSRYQARLVEGGADIERMRAANPLYIPRNHKVEEALAAAQAGDLAPFERLLTVLAAPFEAVSGQEAYAEPAEDGSTGYRTFCGT